MIKKKNDLKNKPNFTPLKKNRKEKKLHPKLAEKRK